MKTGEHIVAATFPDAVKKAVSYMDNGVLEEYRELKRTRPEGNTRKEKNDHKKALRDAIDTFESTRIQQWLQRIKQSFVRGAQGEALNSERFKKRMLMLEDMHHNKICITPQFDYRTIARLNAPRIETNQEPLSKEDVQLKEHEVLQQRINTLHQWFSHMLTPGDEPYRQSGAEWFAYLVLEAVLTRRIHEQGQVIQHTRESNADFTALDHGALAQVYEDMARLLKQVNTQKSNSLDTLAGYDFHKNYHRFLEESKQKSQEIFDYPDGFSDPIRGAYEVARISAGTPWCLKALSTAQSFCKDNGGIVFLFKNGRPHIAMHVVGTKPPYELRQVRGADDSSQNFGNYGYAFEHERNTTLQDGTSKYTNAKQWEKQSLHTRTLARVSAKIESNHLFSADILEDIADLRFLYEVDEPIKGFGYKPTKKIQALRNARKPLWTQDIMLACECTSENQIARTIDEVQDDTKVYIGALTPNIFAKLSHVEHIYTNFPEKKLEHITLNQIGGEDGATVLSLIQDKFKKDGSGRVSNRAQSMHVQNGQPHPEFEAHRLHQKQDVHLVRLSVRDIMGEAFWRTHSTATTQQIYARFLELGLDWCPPEVGAQLWLQNKVIDWTFVGMKQIRVSDGRPHVFYCRWDGDEPWFGNHWADPGYEWGAGTHFVFRVRNDAR